MQPAARVLTAHIASTTSQVVIHVCLFTSFISRRPHCDSLGRPRLGCGQHDSLIAPNQ